MSREIGLLAALPLSSLGPAWARSFAAGFAVAAGFDDLELASQLQRPWR